MANQWHRCERWIRLGIGCPVPHEEEEEDSEEAERSLGVENVQVAAGGVGAIGSYVVDAVTVISEGGEQVQQQQQRGVIREPSGGGGQLGTPQVVTAIPVAPPLDLSTPDIGGGATPAFIPAGDRGGTGAIGTPGLGALLLGAFVTALADITTKLDTAKPGAILRMPGPPQLKAAIAAGLIVAASMENLESAFTYLLGERAGRFEINEGDETDLDPGAAPGAPPGIAADLEFQTQNPARGFLTDMSQMFVPPDEPDQPSDN